MSKVLILFYQPIIDKTNPMGIVCYYEAFAKKLQEAGNEVKVVNVNFIKKYWDETLKENKNKNIFLEMLEKFNPDIIFTFNNQMTEDIISKTNCPICLFDADSINLFPGKDLIKKYSERYYMFTSYGEWEKSKYEYIGIKNDHVGCIHSATDIQNEKIEKDKNISFIGSIFSTLDDDLYNKLDNQIKKELSEDIKEYYKSGCTETDKFTEKYSKKFDIGTPYMYPFIDPRLLILNSIWDLGLTLYGVNWNSLTNFDLLLKLSYNDTPTYTLKHNQDVYNSSVINLSISHPQCKGYTYPWRCYDVMASNGVLVSSYSKLLEEQTKSYVEIPMYKSPYEARDLCKYVIENKSYQEDIIEASNKFIKEKGGWEDNFETIQNITNVKLLNQTNSTPNFEVINFLVSKTFTKSQKQMKEIAKILPYFIAKKIIKDLYDETETDK